MAQATGYLASNRRLRFDHLFGFRAWGLVLYGCLPASLAALGVVRIERVDVRGDVILPVVLLAAIPTALTFLLLRQRLAAWYLLREGLLVRSICLTLAILVVSSVISGAAGLVKGTYIYAWHPPNPWQLERMWPPVVESVLTAAILLVGSTTLFLTAVKETGGLPQLPSAEFVTDIKTVRDKIGSIQADLAQKGSASLSGLAEPLTTAIATVVRLERTSPEGSPRREFYARLAADLRDFSIGRGQAQSVSVQWQLLFVMPSQTANDDERRIAAAIGRIRDLRVDA
jgi:hypothetical protein